MKSIVSSAIYDPNGKTHHGKETIIQGSKIVYFQKFQSVLTENWEASAGFTSAFLESMHQGVLFEAASTIQMVKPSVRA